MEGRREGLDGFEPFIVPSPRLCRRSLTVGLLALALALALLDVTQPGCAAEAAPPRDPELSHQGRTLGKPGPWGQIEYVRMMIERPEAVIPEFPKTNTPTRWFFPGFGRPDLIRLLDDLPITTPQRSALLDSNRMALATNGIWVTPPREVILGLTVDARSQLYGLLADSPENDYQRNPFSILGESPSEWFRESRLTPSTLDLLRPLFYRRGHALCFSDLPDVLPAIPDERERRRLWRTLSREATVLMKLRVTPQSDVEQLVSYWGRGGKGTALRPLFESLVRVDGGVLVDVTHFLPLFARERLYTYPPSTDPRAAGYDCFWSAMNFFNAEPDLAFLEQKRWEAALKEFYVTVKGEPTFGDLVFLLNPDGGAFHAAVYIADGIVFSKNGASYAQPWILMTLADMLAFYEAEKPVRIVLKRRKEIPANGGPVDAVKPPAAGISDRNR